MKYRVKIGTYVISGCSFVVQDTKKGQLFYPDEIWLFDITSGIELLHKSHYDDASDLGGALFSSKYNNHDFFVDAISYITFDNIKEEIDFNFTKPFELRIEEDKNFGTLERYKFGLYYECDTKEDAVELKFKL